MAEGRGAGRRDRAFEHDRSMLGSRDRVDLAPSPAGRTILPAIGRAAAPAAVGLFLLLALGLRVWGMPDGGLLYYDEGWAARDGRLLISTIVKPSGWIALFQHFAYLKGDWKPAHDLLLGSLLAAGVPPDHLPWFAGLAGGVMMVTVAGLAARRWGWPAGAVAGVVVGALPLSVYYGHHVLAEPDGLAGLAVALCFWDRFWIRPARRAALAALAACLVTLTLNYRFLPTIWPLIATVAWRHFDRDKSNQRWGGRIVGICLLPTLAVILIYFFLLTGTQLLHLEQVRPLILKVVRGGSDRLTPFSFPDFYVRTFWEFGGGVVLAATLILGGVAAVRSRLRDGELLLLATGCLAGTLLFFSAVHDKAPRAVVAGIPFAALIAARGITLWRNRAWQWVGAAVICTAMLISGWIGSSAAREPGGISAAAGWLASHPGTIVADRPPTIELYLRQDRWDTGVPERTRAIRDPHAFATLNEMRAAGVRWVVVDANTWILPASAVSRQLALCGKPAAAFDDRASWSRLWFLDGADTVHLGYDGTLAVRDRDLAASRGTIAIQIYDLEGPDTAGCS